jgi:hypothetical protein
MGGVGRAILHNIVTASYRDQVYSVNPRALHMEGVPCLPSVAVLPEPVGLAVIAVPPPAVPAEGADAILALVLPTAATGDLIGAIRAANLRIPLTAVVLDQAEPTRLPAPVDAIEAPASRSAASRPRPLRKLRCSPWRARPPTVPGGRGRKTLVSPAKAASSTRTRARTRPRA